MGRRLSCMTWQDLKEEMSIAGDPDIIVEIGKDIESLITPRMDIHNLAAIANMQLALQKVLAGLKSWEKIEYKRQHS